MSDSTRSSGTRGRRRQRLPDWRSVASAALVLGSLACTTAAPPVPPPVAAPAAPTVEAGGERLLGAFVGAGSGVAAFKGIPYAAPPVGELRWKPPLPHTPRPGVQQATEFAPACPQAADNPRFYRYIAEALGAGPEPRPGARSEQRELPLPQRLDTQPRRQGARPGNGVDPRWLQRERHCDDDIHRRREPRAQGRRGRVDQLPPQPVRVPRPPGADRRVRARIVGQLRFARPDRRPASGCRRTQQPSAGTRAG